jgi:DivIVA domain-containing protein
LSLTPEDIEKKRFHDAWRGYNHEEVDVFLDEVSSSFTALTQQGDQAAQRIRDLESQLEAAQRSQGERERALSDLRRQLDDANHELQNANQGLSEVRGTEGLLKRTLLAAQRAADEAVAEAEREAAETVAAARRQAEEAVTQARQEAETARAGARREAETARSAARREADQAVADARRQAAAIRAEAAKRRETIIAGAEQEIRELSEANARLRSLYIGHHTQLREFLDRQLKALSELPLPEDAGTPGSGRRRFVLGSRAGSPPEASGEEEAWHAPAVPMEAEVAGEAEPAGDEEEAIAGEELPPPGAAAAGAAGEGAASVNGTGSPSPANEPGAAAGLGRPAALGEPLPEAGPEEPSGGGRLRPSPWGRPASSFAAGTTTPGDTEPGRPGEDREADGHDEPGPSVRELFWGKH